MTPISGKSVESGKRVAVVILNWNGEKLLREYLPSVIAHTPSAIADVIVADNGSTDDSISLLHSEFPSVVRMEFAENYGFAEGYNRALRQLQGEYKYAVLLNSDVAVADDWLTPLLRFMESHPEAGAVQPKILSVSDPEKFEYAGASGGFIDRNGYPYCRGRIFSDVETDCGQYDTPIEVDWASGAALMVEIALYLEVGGLDPLFFAHMEEIDLCWRIRLSGRQVWAVPDGRVFHLGGGSLPASNPRKTYLNFRNNLLMLHKNLPPKVRRWRLIKRRLLDTLAWLRFVAGGDFANAREILRAHRDYVSMIRKYPPEAFAAAGVSDLIASRPNILTAYYLRGKHRYSEI